MVYRETHDGGQGCVQRRGEELKEDARFETNTVVRPKASTLESVSETSWLGPTMKTGGKAS